MDEDELANLARRRCGCWSLHGPAPGRCPGCCTQYDDLVFDGRGRLRCPSCAKRWPNGLSPSALRFLAAEAEMEGR